MSILVIAVHQDLCHPALFLVVIATIYRHACLHYTYVPFRTSKTHTLV